MSKLPKSIIKKYGITRKAWQVFRGQKSPNRRKKTIKVFSMAKRRRFFKKAKSYAKKNFSLGGALKVLAGAALAAAYEVFVSPMIPLGAQIKNIIELIVGLALAVIPKMPTIVRSFGVALATVNAYSLAYGWINGMKGTSAASASWSE